MTTIAPPSAERAPGSAPADATGPSSVLARAIVRTRARDDAWVLPATAAVLVLATVLYVVNLTVSGYANVFYSGAAWAASQSWSAWFMGSIDPANFITVDKPPLATMVMGLSVRLFGLSPASILLPQALMGVATVGAADGDRAPHVRRAGLDHRRPGDGAHARRGPDLPLQQPRRPADAPARRLRVCPHPGARDRPPPLARARRRPRRASRSRPSSSRATWSCRPSRSPRRSPAAARSAAGSPAWRCRPSSVVVASAWWVVGMELIPAASRAYIGGSTDGSALDLVLRLRRPRPDLRRDRQQRRRRRGRRRLLRHARDPAPVQRGARRPGRLVPAAGRRRPGGRAASPGSARPRTDLARAAFLLWGGWLAVHAIVFSFMSGVIHSYYVVAWRRRSARSSAAASSTMWRARERHPWAAIVLGLAIAGSAGVALMLLDRTPSFVPGLGLA